MWCGGNRSVCGLAHCHGTWTLPRVISFKWKDLVIDCVINLEVTCGNCSVCGLVETIPCVVWHIAMGHGL